MNPNKQLWEKGDFTRIAATMREAGEALYDRDFCHLPARCGRPLSD